MTTIFESHTRAQLIHRIERIDKDKKPKWGKMNVFQILKHNTYWNEWVLSTTDPVYKQAFMGKMVGKLVLKRMI